MNGNVLLPECGYPDLVVISNGFTKSVPKGYMNFLTKTLGSLTGTSIPYTFGSIVQPSHLDSPSSTSLWKIHDATSDKDSRPVTIFEFDLKHPGNSRYVPLVQNAVKKHRALALLPGVLSIVEIIESEKTIYLITEHTIPLSHIISEYSGELKLLGVFQLTLALKFINIEGSCVHGNPRLENVFVTDSREWKLGGFEFTINYKDDSNDYLTLYSMYTSLTSSKGLIVPPEFESSGSDFFKGLGKGIKGTKFDSYLFGLTAYQIMTNKPPSVAEIMRSGSIKGLTLNKLVAPSIGLRITIEQFMSNGEMSYFATKEIHAYSKFSQISLLSLDQKLEVYKALVSGNTPTEFLEIKVMPEIANTFDTITSNENNVQTTLIYLIYLIHSECEGESKYFEMFFKPLYFKSFLLADRAVRTIILKILPKVIDKISKHEVQDRIYPNLVSGFADTDITVRTETLLSISYIMDKITDRQLNNDLLRYLAKLQADQNPQLRANTVICLTRISAKMQSTTRIGVLVTAFGKALRDPDYVTRLCAVRGFESSIDYFTPEICCSKVLSALSPALLDTSSIIRNEAEKVFELYMKKIRDASTKLHKIEEDTHILDDVSNLTNLLNSLSLENLGHNLLDSISNLHTSTPYPESRMGGNSLNLANKLTSKDNLIDEDFDLDDDVDDWGFDDGESESKSGTENGLSSTWKPSETSKPSNSSEKKFTFPSAKVNEFKKTSLVLGKKKTAAKLNLTVEPVDDDDGWGDGW